MSYATVNSDGARPQPSLCQLAQSKALDNMLQPDFKFADFEEMEPRLQHMLFDALLAETKRLRTIEASWLYMKENCPRADFALYQEPSDSDTPSDEETDEDNDGSMQTPAEKEFFRVNGEKIQSFRRLWTPVSDSFVPNIDRTSEGYIEWNEQEIAADSSDADLEREQPWESYAYGESLVDRVSSQLLFYRLAMIFGKPMLSRCETDYDDWTRCWAFGLEFHDETGWLSIFDTSGDPYISFEGTSEASSAKALELLNYVSRGSCMNPNGYVSGGCPT